MTLLEGFAHSLVTSDAALEANVDAAIPCVLLDIGGAWIAGRATSEAAALAAGDPGPLGAGLLDRVARAVATVRLTETDDIHLGSCITPGAIIVPSVLLMAPAFAAPAARIRRAIAAGYEAMIRFGQSVRGPEILYRGLWPSFLAAPFGSAAAIAVLAGLDAPATADALAIALAQISGAAGQGTSTGKNPRWLLAGLAARAGCVAALAARSGFGGDRQLLEEDWLQRTHAIAFDPTPLAEARPGAALGEISRKPVCAARQTIAAIEAFSQLLAAGADPEKIVRIRVHVPDVYRAMIARPPAGRQGKISSVAYLLALAAYRPGDLVEIERPERDDPRLAAFLPRVEVVADPVLDRLYPQRWPARVEIELADGSRRTLEIEMAYGDAGRPLSEADLVAKFLRLARPVVGEAAADQGVSLALSASADCDAFSRLGGLFENEVAP